MFSSVYPTDTPPGVSAAGCTMVPRAMPQSRQRSGIISACTIVPAWLLWTHHS